MTGQINIGERLVHGVFLVVFGIVLVIWPSSTPSAKFVSPFVEPEIWR